MTMIATPSRHVAAWALVGYTGLYLVFAFLDWVLPDGRPFGARSAGAGFTALVELALPLAGVLLATGAGLATALPRAKLISSVALVEYACATVLGALAWLFGLATAGRGDANDAMARVLLGLGRLGLVALAGLVVYRAWVRLGGLLPVRVVRATPPAG